jgi:hypothetical protein
VPASRSALALVLALASGCAARATFVPPSGDGTPDPGAAARFTALTAPCADTTSFTAEAALSGRINGSRVRGRLHLGVTSRGDIRLEAVAPFGPPIFILAGASEAATLYLPREARVLRETPPADIVEALAGVRLGPADILDMSTACLGRGRAVERAVQFPGGVRRVDVAGDLRVWWQEAGGAFRPLAAKLGDLRVTYEPIDEAGLRAVRLERADAAGRSMVDVRLAFSQRERNVALGPDAFALDVPAAAQPLSLQTVRESGLLGR